MTNAENIVHWQNVVKRAGHKSLRSFALDSGFSPFTVYAVVRFWGGREDRPLGGISRQIMSALRELDTPHAA